MDWKYLFTSFEGRIGRQQWWLGTLVLIVAALLVYFVILPILGLSMIGGFDPSSGIDGMMAMMRKAAVIQLVLTAILAFPVTALMKKRLNDRDRPGWLVYLFWAPTALNLLLGVTGLGYSITDMGGMMVPGPSAIGWIVSLSGFAIGLWSLIELGILRGTAGQNPHGPDPIAE